MRCDPSWTGLEQFELQYPFRYYSSFSQPHCFSGRLSVFIGPRFRSNLSLRQIMHVSHVSPGRRRDGGITTQQHSTFAVYTSTSTSTASPRSGQCFICLPRRQPPPHRGVTACMTPSAFYRANRSTWDHMLILFLGTAGWTMHSRDAFD